MDRQILHYLPGCQAIHAFAWIYGNEMADTLAKSGSAFNCLEYKVGRYTFMVGKKKGKKSCCETINKGTAQVGGVKDHEARQKGRHGRRVCSSSNSRNKYTI